MKKIIFIFILIITCSSNKFFAQNWLWARDGKGNGGAESWSIKADNLGNVYATGTFQTSSITFGSYTINNMGLEDIFLVKYDSMGNTLWARGVGSPDYDEGWSVAIDASNNVYVTGTYDSPTITFGTYTLNNGGLRNAYLVKYSQAGNVIWAKNVGISNENYGDKLATDILGNVYVAGQFASPNLIFASDTLINGGYYNIFLAKYDSSGNYIWAKSPLGDTSGLYSGISWGLATDSHSNIYMTGYFTAPKIIFDTDTLINKGNHNIFLTKYNSAGNVIWARSAGGTSIDEGYSVAIDKRNNIYLTGVFSSNTISFGAYNFSNTGSPGTYDAFFTKYDTSGLVLWSKSIGGANDEKGWDVATDANNNVYFSGSFYSPTISFGTHILNYPSGVSFPDPMFIVKYDSTGSPQCAISLASGGDDNNGITLDKRSNVYVEGDFAISPFIVGNDTLIKGPTLENIFMAKLSMNCNIQSVNEISNKENISIYPNPTTGIVKIETQSKIAEIKITNLIGEQIITPSAFGISPTGEKFSFDVSSLQNGIYFLQIKTPEGVLTKKIIVQH